VQELRENNCGRVRSLLGDLVNCHVCIDGVLEGQNPGAVYVDDSVAPQTVLLIGPEGTYLGGDSPATAQVTALKDLVTDLMYRQGIDVLWIACDPAWESRLVDMLPWPPLHQPRQHYICTALALDWHACMPTGFAVRPITQELLDYPSLDIPDHVHDWMEGNWGSTGDFLAHGFGFVTVDEVHNRVASWSLCDCTGGGVCEIGIHTHPEYRRRGLATITAAAAVDHALTHGFRSVGWHCNAENAGSRRTALKVGFVWERDYVHHICFRSEAVHWTEAARLQEVHGDHRAAADLYTRADAAEDQPVWGYYIPFYAACAFARLGDYPAAWNWLHRAAARGFDDLDCLQTNEALDPMKTTAEWAALVQMIAEIR
jgi:RimJ/RimL family protein N-acetyltransferase